MERLTLTRALVELKTINDRIASATSVLLVVDIKNNKYPGIALTSKQTVGEFVKKGKAQYQSINDLIDRRTRIKSAIAKANASCMVNLNGVEMSIAEAIEKKAFLPYKERLLVTLKNQKAKISKQVDDIMTKLDADVASMLLQSAGKDRKANKEEYDSIASPYLEHNKHEIVEAIDTDKEIEKLEKEIYEFKMNVDIVLSEANAKNEIEI